MKFRDGIGGHMVFGQAENHVNDFKVNISDTCFNQEITAKKLKI
ncbi:hypothetical protein [uncultured Methanobrevibacter sp.]|nr:hypothetical protein [uncultured Methanobrevibacter sp.]